MLGKKRSFLGQFEVLVALKIWWYYIQAGIE